MGREPERKVQDSQKQFFKPPQLKLQLVKKNCCQSRAMAMLAGWKILSLNSKVGGDRGLYANGRGDGEETTFCTMELPAQEKKCSVRMHDGVLRGGYVACIWRHRV